MNGCESLHELLAIGTLQLRQHRGPEHVGAHLVVEILRHHLAAGEQVGLREERRLEEFQSLKQKTCQRSETISDHHRALDEHRFERRGAGRQQHDVARRHHLLRVAVDERQPIAHAGRLERGGEGPARAFVGQRSDEPQLGTLPVQPRGGRREVGTQPRDLALPAAGQQRDVRALAIEPERGSRARADRGAAESDPPADGRRTPRARRARRRTASRTAAGTAPGRLRDRWSARDPGATPRSAG